MNLPLLSSYLNKSSCCTHSLYSARASSQLPRISQNSGSVEILISLHILPWLRSLQERDLSELDTSHAIWCPSNDGPRYRRGVRGPSSSVSVSVFSTRRLCSGIVFILRRTSRFLERSGTHSCCIPSWPWGLSGSLSCCGCGMRFEARAFS